MEFVETFARRGRIKLQEAEDARYREIAARVAPGMTDRDWRDLVLVAVDQTGARPDTIERIAELLLNDDRVAS